MKRKTTTTTATDLKKLKTTIKITEKQLNHYTFKKQGLIERKEFKKIPVEYLPLHGTSHTTPFISLFSRIKDITPEDVSNQLYTKSTEYPLKRCMRGTLHILPAEQLSTIQAIYGKDCWEVVGMKQTGFEQKEISVLFEPVKKILAENGPMTTNSIKKLIPPKLIKSNKYKNTNLTYAMKYLYSKGEVDYGSNELEDEKDWRDSNRKYALNTLEFDELSFSDAVKKLGVWYFDLYGPASFKDFIWWSGLQVTKVRKEIEEILEEYEKIEVRGYSTMFISKNEIQDLKETPDSYPEFLRFLPYEDAMVKAYKETRCRFFNKEVDEKVVQRGELMPSVWKNGTAIGLFNWSKNSDLVLNLFEEEDEDVFKEEIELMKKFLGFKNVKFE